MFEQIFLKVAEDNGVDAEMSGKIQHSSIIVFNTLILKYFLIQSVGTCELQSLPLCC